jgi:hypothetical protein
MQEARCRAPAKKSPGQVNHLRARACQAGRDARRIIVCRS